MKGYVKIELKDFKSLMDTMKFVEVQIEGTFERVWKFEVPNTNFDIRIYSTIGINEEFSRGSGTDAIRCVAYDRAANKVLKLEKRVHRTISALINTRERCRDIYKHIKKHTCKCGGIMMQRESKYNHKFMGCSNYPICKNTKNIVIDQLKLKLKS